MNENLDNCLFLDLKEYEHKNMAKAMDKKVRKIEEYRGRVGDRIYFEFKQKSDKLNFILSITQVLHLQGYRTAFIKDNDPNFPIKNENQQTVFNRSAIKNPIRSSSRHGRNRRYR